MSDNTMTTFVSILVESLTRSQLDEILEQVTHAYTPYGCCPLCGMAELPEDHEGNLIEPGEDVSGVTWREHHDDECPVTLIESSFR